MARDFLAIPVTSTSVERVFSRSRHICTDVRSSLQAGSARLFSQNFGSGMVCLMFLGLVGHANASVRFEFDHCPNFRIASLYNRIHTVYTVYVYVSVCIDRFVYTYTIRLEPWLCFRYFHYSWAGEGFVLATSRSNRFLASLFNPPPEASFPVFAQYTHPFTSFRLDDNFMVKPLLARITSNQ